MTDDAHVNRPDAPNVDPEIIALVETMERRLTTPRAAAIAGIVFALLLGTSYVLLRLSVPADPAAGEGWIESGRTKVRIALTLVPFAGIAFLWFIGVLRDRLGELEDRFFATVFFGSGVLFLAMTFAAAAIGSGLLASYTHNPEGVIESGVFDFGRQTMFRVANVYAIKMASVFMMSLATVWTRTRTMPRPLAVATYASAIVLMLVTSLSLWMALVFPVWVLVISVYILTRNVRRTVLSPAT